jgi:hypothetical protein
MSQENGPALLVLLIVIAAVTAIFIVLINHFAM